MNATSWWSIIALTVAAGIQTVSLSKEWKEKGERKRRHRIALLALTLIGLFVGMYLVHRTSKESKTERDANSQRIATLQQVVVTQTQNNETQYQRNQAELHRLEAQLAIIKAEVTSEPLRQKITTLQGQLEKSMAPAPKASLLFSFVPFSRAVGPISPVTEVNLRERPDGSLHVDFTIINPTDVDAEEIVINFDICDLCKFSTEPTGMKKLEGLSETQRYFALNALHSHEALKTMSVDFTVPPTVQTVGLGIEYRCRTCIVPSTASLGTVHILRGQ